MLLFLAAWLGIALCSLGESLDEGFGPAPAAEAGAFRLIQRKPYDRGNCFHWPGCRGESIGAMWVHAPEFCAALGGRSWLDESTGRCYDLRPGPRGLMGLQRALRLAMSQFAIENEI